MEAADMKGIAQSVVDEYGERRLRILTNSRSDARGIYRRGGEDAFTAAIPLNAHKRNAAKGWTLVAVSHIPDGTEQAPWTSEIS
jgi:hypothetical protein